MVHGLTLLLQNLKRHWAASCVGPEWVRIGPAWRRSKNIVAPGVVCCLR